MMRLLDFNPLLLLDRWSAMRRLGRGVRFVVPDGVPLQKARRTLSRYGVRTYAYKFVGRNEREFRVRSEQAEWAAYLLQRAGVPVLDGPPVNAAPGAMPKAWSEANPGAKAKPVGFAGMMLDMFDWF